jgi:uncharacterized protein YndB with AHSA1/START domain
MTDAQGFTVTRIFDAPRERVWSEWIEPERFAGWYGGPGADIPIDTVAMDVRAGGSWRATMFFGPQRHEIRWEGDYLEVAAPERLVFTITDQPGGEERDRCTVILTDLGDGRTEMRFEQSGGGLTPAGYEAAKQGWGGFFDHMAERLAADR